MADFFLNQGSGGFAGSKAADADPRRELLIRLLHRLGLLLFIDLDLQLYLSLGKSLACYFHFFSFAAQTAACVISGS